jgi:hypothetical protein
MTLHADILAAAKLLADNAEVTRIAYTVDGVWDDDEPEAQAECAELIALAERLRAQAFALVTADQRSDRLEAALRALVAHLLPQTPLSQLRLFAEPWPQVREALEEKG